MNGLSIFGLVAVGLMLIFYSLEGRSNWFVLAFAGACVLASAYGFLQGAWPFGLVEGVWAIVAFRRWAVTSPKPRRATPAPAIEVDRPIDSFFTALRADAKPIGRGDWRFFDLESDNLGFVQFIIESPERLTIHRLKAARPGGGAGSMMLQKLCDVADDHGVELSLKALPFGEKPYPLSRDQLACWYGRYGFEGTRKKMLRTPRTAASVTEAPIAVAELAIA